MKFSRKCAEFIIREIEKDYVNDPNDTGGETRWGISKRSYPKLDIRNLSKDKALDIYERDFAWPICFDQVASVNPRLAFYLLDFAIHSGPVTAVKYFQKSAKISQDGKVGPATLRAAARTEASELLMAARAVRFTTLRNYSKYATGWNKRLFILPRFQI